MANAPVDPNVASAAAVADVKRLMRLARTGALATLEATGGAPLTTLIGVASDFDGAPLFLMSTLSRHTRNLAADPRASLLLTGGHDRGDPLNHPRVTLSGHVERCPRRAPRFGICSGTPRLASMLVSPISPFTSSRSTTCISTAASAGPPHSRRPEVLASRAGRSRAGRGRRAAHRRSERAWPGGARAARWAQAVRAGLAGDRARRRGSRPRRRRSRRPRPIRRARRMIRSNGGGVSKSCSRPVSEPDAPVCGGSKRQ